MTELEVRREIFYTITECKDHNGEPLVSHIDTARGAALERKRSRGPPAGPRDNHGQRLLSGLPRYRCRPKSGEERVQVIVDALAARLRWP
jgi:hypothetical protein